MTAAGRTWKMVIAVGLVAGLAAACARPHFPGYVIVPYEPETPPGEVLDLPAPDTTDPNRRCHRILAIEVRKSERSLVAQCADGEPIHFRAALGREPRGPKERRGDMRTPEGSYRIAGPPRASRFHIFVPIDYPAESDVERAVSLGVISDAEGQRILAARSADQLPPQNTRLGGHLGIHGEGPRWRGDSAGLNWTDGCVGLADHDVEFLSTRVDTGTPVIIFP